MLVIEPISRYSRATMRSGLFRFPFLAVGLLCIAASSFAQNPPSQSPSAGAAKTSSPAAASDYSNEGSVIEQSSTSFKFENDGSGDEIQYAKIRIQNAQALQAWGQLVFTYSAASDKISVDFVRVHKADGHVVTADADAVQDLSSPVEHVAPMYTDIRQIHITVPDLNVGDTLEYQIHSITIHPLVPGQFFTQWNSSKQIITLEETFKVDLPRARQLHVKTSNGIAAPGIVDQGDRRIYTWHSSFTKRPDDSSDNDQKKKKSKEPELSDVQISTFSDWAQLGQWYAGLQKSRVDVSDTVHAKAEELVKGLANPADKANAIYNYVSKNIRYVSLSFGLGRYQPHSAADVLSNQYGDCKDKATLLEALLAAEHIDAYPVLINSAHKIDPDIPSPAQFDHLINIVVLDGKERWADTTPGVAPFEYLLPPLRDKQALVIPQNAVASLQKTPIDPPFVPVTTVAIDGQVDSFGRMKGKLTLSGTGGFAVLLRTVLRLVPQNNWPEMAGRFVKTFVGNNAEKNDFHFSNIEDIDRPLIFESEFTESNFLDLSRKDTSVYLPSTMTIENTVQPDKDSTDPFKISEIVDQTENWRIALPSQITPTLPLPVHITRDYADYQSVYSLNGATVTATRHIALRQSQLPPARYNDWEAFHAAMQGDVNQKLEFANASPGNSSIPSGASADDLYNAALDAERAGNWMLSAKLYAAAGDKDPDHDAVWNALGHAYNMLHQYNAAIPALQKAIAKNPYDSYAYNNLGLAYQGLGRYDDATKEFLKQIEVNPLDQYAHANLASLYLRQKKYAAAQTEYQTALKITPNDFNLQIGLGTADLGLHQDDAALAAFHIALEKAPSPVIWNNVAYYLADNNSHLDLAQQYSENSIRAVEAQLNATSLDTVGPTQAGLVASIVTFWDTMGWIKFKQGNLPAAESYLHAAWFLSDDATIGDHLGQIYEKEGRRDDAIKAYALALTYPNPSIETRSRLVALVGEKHADAEISFARASQRRSITLPNPQRIDADAEFWVLLSSPVTAAGAKASDPSVDVRFIAIDDNFEKKSKGAAAGKDAKDASEKTNDKLAGVFRDYAANLRASKFPYSFPQGESAKILLRGVLTCNALTQQPSCDFTPFPAERAVIMSLSPSSAVLPQ